MPQIIPIRDLKDTTKISELCHNSTQPIYITKNGYGDMVIMSIEKYEELMKKIHLYSELEISEQQIKNGEVMDASLSLNLLKDKYGL